MAGLQASVSPVSSRAALRSAAALPSRALRTVRDVHRHRLDAVLLFGVAVFVLLVSVRLKQRLVFGPSWDAYAFLCNAADLAGRSVGYVEPHRPMLLPWITSFVLRTGFFETAAIQYVDAAFTVLGLTGFYLLLRRRFERPLALAAAVVLLLMPPVWSWLGAGYTDFPSVAISIWALLFTVKATEDHPMWYLAAFPALVLAVLMRFGAILMVFPVLVWLLVRGDLLDHHKFMKWGLILAALTYVPAGIYYASFFSDPFFPFGFAGRVAESGLVGGVKVSPSRYSWIPGWYYISNLSKMSFRDIGDPEQILWVLGTAAVGIAIACCAAMLRQRRKASVLVPVLAAVVVAAAFFRAGTLVRVLSITFFGMSIAWLVVPSWSGGGQESAARSPWRRAHGLAPGAMLALDAAVLTWGLLFFDAHAHLGVKTDRYFIAFAAPLVYLLVLGLRSAGVPLTAVVRTIRSFRLEGPNTYSWQAGIVPLMVLAPALLSALASVHKANEALLSRARDPVVYSARRTAEWLKENDPQIASKTVYSDVWPLTSWYLGQEAHAMPTFEMKKAFGHELRKNRADYYITLRPHRYPGYEQVFRSTPATVLRAHAPFVRSLPAVLYIGDGWDAYLEPICDFDFNLYFSSRRKPSTGTWLLDSMSAEELSKFDAVAVFGARWRDKARAQEILREYVRNGGVLIVDPSLNMDPLAYPLTDTVFMDVVIRRRRVPPAAILHVSDELATIARVPRQFRPGRFVTERYGPWFAARTTPAPWAEKAPGSSGTFRVLATLNGKPAVVLQRYGSGRIYWLSGNLVWHAYLRGTEREIRLIRGLFRAALGLPPIPDAEVAPGAKPWFLSREMRRLREAWSKDPLRRGQIPEILPDVAHSPARPDVMVGSALP